MDSENGDLRVEDLPEDLTPFIDRATLDFVGGGGYSYVWKGSCAYSVSALVAVKAFRFPDDYDLHTINRKISRELGILKILDHNNIVPLWGIATGFGPMPELRCLVSPWMPNGRLNDYLVSNHHDLTVLGRSRLLEDVSAGLRYLHSVPVMHGDITGANILIDKGGHARLIDFGLSTIIQPLLGQSHLVATSVRPGAIRYAAPELVRQDSAHDLVSLEKTDIYSFGCVMLQVLSGRLPWSEVTTRMPDLRITAMILEGRGPQRPDGHPAIIDLDWRFIQKCLRSEPELRPSAEEVLDFVMHRFSSTDSSRPPDDPPDDAPHGFPGASPDSGSGDSDVTEQFPILPYYGDGLKILTTTMDGLFASTGSGDSDVTEQFPIPPYPDHGLNFLTTTMGDLFASTDSGDLDVTEQFSILPYSDHGLNLFTTSMDDLFASTSSTPTHSVLRRSRIESSGSSTKPEPSGRSPEDILPCSWGISHGSYCGRMLSRRDLLSHVREVHGTRGPATSHVQCKWNDCGRMMARRALFRHVQEVHIKLVYSCECGKTFSRKDGLNQHKKKSCSDQQ